MPRLYPPTRGEEFPNLALAMIGRAIDWELVAATHPTYQAMQEIGRAQRTIFACRYLRDRDLQREINAALNVAESWNAGNAVLHYGKGGDIPGNRRDEQELG